MKRLTQHDRFGDDDKVKRRYKEISSLWGDNPDIKNIGSMHITSTNINGLSDIIEYSQYIVGNVQFESDVHCYQEINL